MTDEVIESVELAAELRRDRERVTVEAMAEKLIVLERIALKQHGELHNIRQSRALILAQLERNERAVARLAAYKKQHRDLVKAHRLLVLEHKELERQYVELARDHHLARQALKDATDGS
jgi:hypothetical protein